MDEADRAQQEEARLLKEALEGARRHLPKDSSAVHFECVECGDEIPEKRRLALPGVAYCVLCKTRIEKGRGVR